MDVAKDIISIIESRQDVDKFQELNWRGSFEDYLNIVVTNPAVARTAFQRIYEMILSHGVEEYTEHKKKIFKYKFFDDIQENGCDAVYGLQHALMKSSQGDTERILQHRVAPGGRSLEMQPTWS